MDIYNTLSLLYTYLSIVLCQVLNLIHISLIIIMYYYYYHELLTTYLGR